MNKKLIKELKDCKKRSPWDLANDDLYNLCKENFNHKKMDEIIAKTMIIGRTYAASLDRKKKGEKINTYDFYTKEVFKALKDEAFNSNLQNLRGKRLSKGNLSKVITTHNELMNLLSKCVRQKNRSFASKYLHFHLPNLFFIYDQYANKEVRKLIKEINLCRGFKKIKINVSPNLFDKEYFNFVINCFSVRQFSNKEGYRLKPRELDNLLLARNRKRKKRPSKEK